MTKKTEQERIEELEEKMKKMKAKKQQLEARMKEKERKARTKRLIQVGAIFEKYFEFEGEEDAEKIALAYQKSVKENKEKILSRSVEEIEKMKNTKETKETVPTN